MTESIQTADIIIRDGIIIDGAGGPRFRGDVAVKNGKIAAQKKLSKGDHFVEVPLESVVFFVRDKKKVPLARPAQCVDKLDWKRLSFAGDQNAAYELVDRD